MTKRKQRSASSARRGGVGRATVLSRKKVKREGEAWAASVVKVKVEVGLVELPLPKPYVKTVEGETTRGPFPGWPKPSRADAFRAHAELVSVHGDIDVPKNTSRSVPVLDSLVRTILSQNTTDITSARAFAQLKKRFPTYEAMEHARLGQIEKEIKCCGLAEKRANVIKNILGTLRVERGELSMEYLHLLRDSEVKSALCRFKGVGPKTAACVLMFCLNRPEFPVDTHVWRIAKRLKWVKPSASREQTYEHLNARVPDEIKYALHVLMVGHGKCCTACAKNNKPRRKPIHKCPLTLG